MQIDPISPDDPRVTPLIEELDRYQESLYPPESNHLDGPATLMQPNVHFIGALDGDTLAGIGAVKRFTDYGEIKRMFIPEKFRGKGLGRQLMAALETHLIDHGIFIARLETGIHQTPAIRLYESSGFVKCPPFGSYKEDPLSVFMEKELFRVTAFQPDDRDDVVALWEACRLTRPWNDPDKDIRRKMAQNPEEVLVGRIKGKMAATCMFGYDGHRGWIYYLGVLPEFQKRGLARKIMAHAQQRLAAQGCPKINLMVREGNLDAINFYNAIGYNRDSVATLSKRLEKDD